MNTSINPLVSVLVPAFNEEKYIIKTLDALIQQTYQHFEVIIINNASTDNTTEVVKNFIRNTTGAANIIKLVQEAKQGTNYARECGRKAAKGTIIAQLDADCIPPPHWIEKGVAFLQKNKVAAVTGPYYYFDAPFLRRQFTLIGQVVFYPLINSFTGLFKRGGIIIGGNSFIDAAMLQKAGGYNVDLTFYGDDIDIAKRLLPFGKIGYAAGLVVKTSSRRFNALGFKTVQKKYRKAFWDIVFLKKIKLSDSIEMVHPR